jgi:hypothetical protein
MLLVNFRKQLEEITFGSYFKLLEVRKPARPSFKTIAKPANNGE